MAATINASSSSGIVTTADNSAQLELQTANTTRLTINSSGNVGIGTTSPSNNLSITCGAGDGILINAPTGQANIFLQQAGSTNGTINANGGAGTDLSITGNRTLRLSSGTVGGTSGIVFNTFGSERMRIDSSGNVGIGTTSPAAKLDIGSGNLNFSSTGQRITGDFSNATFANRVAFQSSTTNGNTGVFLLPNGTAGSSAIRCFNNSDPTNASYIGFDTVGNTDTRITTSITGTGTYLPMTFYTGGSERMRIDSSGNVLIGTTTSPAGSKELVLGGDYIEGVVAIGTVTTSHTLSLANGTVQTATLTASTACTFTMPTAIAGKSFILLLKQAAATGNGTATFTGVKWNSSGAPTITATAGRMDILSFVSDGTNWYGSYTQGFTP